MKKIFFCTLLVYIFFSIEVNAKENFFEDAKKKYDESFAAMLMINKYFAAVPFYRQDQLQLMLGVPLPASTQWEILKSH